MICSRDTGQCLHRAHHVVDGLHTTSQVKPEDRLGCVWLRRCSPTSRWFCRSWWSSPSNFRYPKRRRRACRSRSPWWRSRGCRSTCWRRRHRCRWMNRCGCRWRRRCWLRGWSRCRSSRRLGSHWWCSSWWSCRLGCRRRGSRRSRIEWIGMCLVDSGTPVLFVGPVVLHTSKSLIVNSTQDLMLLTDQLELLPDSLGLK